VVVAGDTCVSAQGLATIVGRDKRYRVCGRAHGFYDAGELIRKHRPRCSADWTNFDTNTIGRADLDGSNVNQSFITGASQPFGVAVDAEHLYWANSFITNTIGRADLDGSNPNQSFITGASEPFGVEVDR
jgi:hypothetical protein